MIYLEMYGRLGNQFFRYAAARALQQKFYPEEKIVINFSQIDKAHQYDASFYNVLDDFCVGPYEPYLKTGSVIFNETSLDQKILCVLYYLGLKRFSPEQMREQFLYEKKWVKLLNNRGTYWFRTGFLELSKSSCKNKFLSGAFESPAYFDGIRDILLREFTPKHSLLEKNKSLYEKILTTNSICLSVRRGDFESNASVKSLHSVCHKDYFEKAIRLILERVDNPTFFLFSDDIEWVKANIKPGCETYFEDGTDPVWEKLRLMSACKHFIVSNSSFSWWTQYLSTNQNKVVVSPSRWFNNDYDCPLIDKNWVLVNV